MRNILISADGGVKIGRLSRLEYNSVPLTLLASIGNSMIQQLDHHQQCWDIWAVCCMAEALLGPKGDMGTRGILGCFADDFVKPWPAATAEDLLKV